MASYSKILTICLPVCAAIGFVHPANAAKAEASTASSATAGAASAEARKMPEPKYCAAHEVVNSRILGRSCLTRSDWELRGYELLMRK